MKRVIRQDETKIPGMASRRMARKGETNKLWFEVVTA